MKKIYTLLMLSFVVSVGMAQVKSNRLEIRLKNDAGKPVVKHEKKSLKEATPATAVVSSSDYVPYSFASFQEAMEAKQAAAIETKMTVLYKRPDGVMFEGYTRDYRAYNNTLYTHSPAMVDVLFEPYSNRAGAEFSWYYNGGDSTAIEAPMDENGDLHFTPSITPSGYISYMPRVRATLVDTTVSYVLGKGVTSQYMLAATVERFTTEDGTVFEGALEFPSLTIANMHENKPNSGNLYGGFTGGGAFSPSYTTDDGPVKGVMQVIPQQVSPLYVESMSVLATDEGLVAVPEGGVMKLDLFYLNEDGTLGALIASSTTNEFVKTYDNQGVFIFKFEDEEDGFIVEKPITIGTEAPVVVRLTGFDSTWNFKLLFGVNSWVGSSYTLHGDDLKVSTFGYSNAPTTPRTDLYIHFNGIYNCLVPDEENPELNFPLAGGWGISGYDPEDNSPYNDVILNSSYNMDEDMTDVWIESVPDWVTSYDVDTTYYADYNALIVYFAADPLPEEMTGRSGEIVLASHGVSTKIKAIQGTQTSLKPIIMSDINVTVSNNNFNVKYPADYNEVAVYTISGQQIARYPLSVAGQATIPAEMTKGIYLLKFSGAKTETIKVIK